MNDNLGMLLFESLDSDRYTRTFSPMVITDDSDVYSNTLNEFDDQTWDGFYSGQIRLGRFPAILQTGNAPGASIPREYTLSYTGTQPSTQRFTLIAETGSIIIKI